MRKRKYLITYRTAAGESYKTVVFASSDREAEQELKKEFPNAIPISLERGD